MAVIEVEVKIKISEHTVLIEKLISNGYEFLDEVTETDIYFTSKHHDFKKLDEALRVRKIENKTFNEVSQVITYKGKKLDNISMTREETEIEVSDFNNMIYVFESIGFEKVKPVIKNRKTYKKDNITVCLDQVENLGMFMEIEVLIDDNKKREETLRQIESELMKFGLSIKDSTKESYLAMIMGEKDCQ